ncbi:MAG: HAD-IIA family hydrolase [Candidatus Promineifilaceae bacterium]
MKEIKNLVLDMDGVLWLGMTPMPNLPNFFATLRGLGINFALATNNASRTVDQYIQKFAKFGIEMEGWRILSSAETTAAYLQNEYPTGTRAFVLGGDGLRVAMQTHGFEVINQIGTTIDLDNPPSRDEMDSADVVVIGFNWMATYADFAHATYHINNGARFIGSNPDSSFPAEIGRMPGAGALIALVQTATGVEPTIIGKPFPYIYNEALKRLNATPANTAMVGDRLDTDLLGAQNLGLIKILVRSGISSDADLPGHAVQPDYIFDDINGLAAALKSAN